MFRLFPGLVVLLMVAACGGEGNSGRTAASDGAERPVDRVVVYTSRQPHLIEPLFDRFTTETGIAVQFTTDNEASLIERLAAEGARTNADVFVTVDAGNLWFAAERGLLAELDSGMLEAAIPASLRDEQGRWFGLSLRARTIMFHPERVDASELSTYEDLADPRWQGRLCLRTSRKVYNQSLVAMMIETYGVERTEDIVRGWVGNLATNPFASDTQMIQAIAAGQCDVGIANTSYLGRLLADDPDYPVDLFWANQGAGGVHVNVSGAGLTRHAPRPEAGRALIEWLASESAQGEFAERNLEFPANPAVPVRGLVQEWGDFESDPTPLTVAGERQAEAVRLMDRVGYR